MAIERAERDDTFFLPQGVEDMLSGKNLQPGDVIRFRFVGTDKDGNMEVEYDTGKPEASLHDKLMGDMNNPPPEPVEQEGEY